MFTYRDSDRRVLCRNINKLTFVTGDHDAAGTEICGEAQEETPPIEECANTVGALGDEALTSEAPLPFASSNVTSSDMRDSSLLHMSVIPTGCRGSTMESLGDSLQGQLKGLMSGSLAGLVGN
jgi:hypothetical protein